MTDHTPGPWQYGETTSGPKVRYVHSDEWLIAQVSNHREERATDDANGHLLAAAPELLAACEACYTLIPQLAAAIAKARGEAP